MLETIWFILWGVLWAMYFVLDGFDFGIGTLMPFLAKNETDRRIMYNAQGPFWDGNEVWLITAGGVTFAAFPEVYAVMFSQLYTPLYLLLFALIFRGVTFEFRHLSESPAMKKFMDVCHVLGSFLPALLLGVAFSNIFMGLPLENGVSQGSFFGLLNPYALAGGLLFVTAFCYHGAVWLAIKSPTEMRQRAIRAAEEIWPALVLLAVVFLGASALATDLYANYLKYPFLLFIPMIPVAGLVLTRVALGKRHLWRSWFFSAATIFGTTAFGVAGIFPALLPSSIGPEHSVTIHNGASSPLTLQIMLGVALVMVPAVILYQAWVFKKFSFQIKEEEMIY
ncbi:MAG: cytochrome d ubiquinol oxidase subunit II [Desulfovibrio sp.]|nr:cytochrome d ubiquinol oxidase subunit II [Desulfovibrio sp.]